MQKNLQELNKKMNKEDVENDLRILKGNKK